MEAMEYKDFIQWLDEAEHGDEVVYFKGHLSLFRFKPVLSHGVIEYKVNPTIEGLAQCAMQAHDEGLVILYQRRLADGDFAYCAKRLRKETHARGVRHVRDTATVG